MPITNIPTDEDYHTKATELIYDAFNELYNGNLEKSLASLHHSSELYLKALICKESPYILINIHKSSLPQNGEKDFSDFYSMDAVDLPKMVTFLHGEDILQNIYDKKFKEIYDKIRKTRNKYIHSSENIDYCEKELLLDLLIVFNTFNKEKEFLAYFSEGLGNWEIAEQQITLELIKSNKKIDFLNGSKRQKKLEEHVDKLDNYWKKAFEQCRIGERLNKVSEFIFENLDLKYKKIFYKLPKKFKNNQKTYACYKCSNHIRHNHQFLQQQRSLDCRDHDIDFVQFNTLIKKNKHELWCITCKSEYTLTEYKKCHCCSYYEKDKELKAPFSISFHGNVCLLCGCNEKESNYWEQQ